MENLRESVKNLAKIVREHNPKNDLMEIRMRVKGVGVLEKGSVMYEIECISSNQETASVIVRHDAKESKENPYNENPYKRITGALREVLSEDSSKYRVLGGEEGGILIRYNNEGRSYHENTEDFQRESAIQEIRRQNYIQKNSK